MSEKIEKEADPIRPEARHMDRENPEHFAFEAFMLGLQNSETPRIRLDSYGVQGRSY